MATQPQTCAIGTCAIGILTNRRNAQKSTSPRTLSMSLGAPEDLFMQNKANLLDVQMNISTIITKDYENKSNWTLGENKPNTNPIKPFLEKHTQYDWLKGYLKDLPAEPWTIFPVVDIHLFATDGVGLLWMTYSEN